jgi:hypothetical protein
MVRDLAALPPEFPMMLRQAAATATLAGDIGQLANVGYHFALSFPGGVHTWALVLEERAPTLGGALRLDRAIPAAEAEAPRRTGFRLSGWSLVALAFLLVQIVRCLASDSSSVSRYSDTSYIPSPVTTTTPRSPFSSPSSSPSASSSSSLVNALSAGKPADPMQLAQARGMTDAICAAPRPIGNKACFHAEDLVRHLEHAHCTPARLTLMQYEIEINSWGSHAPRAAGRLETLVRRMVEHTCSGAAP